MLTIEVARRTKSDGSLVLEAFAVISYDDENASYWMRAFNNGRYLETDRDLAGDDKGATGALGWDRSRRLRYYGATTRASGRNWQKQRLALSRRESCWNSASGVRDRRLSINSPFGKTLASKYLLHLRLYAVRKFFDLFRLFYGIE